jgi:uncharacterized membrane protein YphA (DoxX/SURF4 family)
MSSWDQFMEYLVAGVFICVGLAKILSYSSGPRALGAQPAGLPFGLPYGLTPAVGVFEVVAGAALVSPSSYFPEYAPAQLAAAGLALVTAVAAVYHARRRQSMVPNLTLFLLVLFVAIVRWA